MALDSTNVLSMVHSPLVNSKAYVSPQQRGISKFSMWFFFDDLNPPQLEAFNVGAILENPAEIQTT